MYSLNCHEVINLIFINSHGMILPCAGDSWKVSEAINRIIVVVFIGVNYQISKMQVPSYFI